MLQQNRLNYDILGGAYATRVIVYAPLCIVVLNTDQILEKCLGNKRRLYFLREDIYHEIQTLFTAICVTFGFLLWM